MSDKLDVIVLGLGGMGSAAACQLAARGHRVLGLEQFTSPHDRGSSHGHTRVIRQSYFESPAYVPMLLRAYELWGELERSTGRQLMHLCGGLMMGQPDSAVVAGSRASAEKHGLPHDILDPKDIRRRFPALQPPAGTIALFEKNAGYVLTEASVKAHLDRAQHLGARLQFEEEVTGWEAEGGGVRVRSSRGEYQADRLVITAGPWASQVLAGLRLPLEVDRQVLYWLEPSGGIDLFLPDRFPIFIFEAADGLLPYGFPAIDGPGGGVKVALYRAPNTSLCTPATIDRRINDEEIAALRKAIAQIIPSLDGELLKGATCMYTNTPDKDFILDTHPAHPQVSIAAGFSGHGFKFCSVVGEIMADLAEAGQTRHDLGPFRVARFIEKAGSS
jgi:sarcosine oxidase